MDDMTRCLWSGKRERNGRGGSDWDIRIRMKERDGFGKLYVYMGRCDVRCAGHRVRMEVRRTNDAGTTD